MLSGLSPNNSFKPNLLRYTNNMAEKACHVVASATQVGLTQALDGKESALVVAVRRYAQLLLHPTEPGDRIFRVALFLHWVLGGWGALRLISSEHPIASILFCVGAIVFGFIGGMVAFLGAHLFWSCVFRSQAKATNFVTVSGKSLPTQLIYLLPGVPIGWLALFFIQLLASN